MLVEHASVSCILIKDFHMPKTFKGANLNKVCLSYALHGVHTWSSRSYPSFCHMVICFLYILLQALLVVCNILCLVDSGSRQCYYMVSVTQVSCCL